MVTYNQKERVESSARFINQKRLPFLSAMVQLLLLGGLPENSQIVSLHFEYYYIVARMARCFDFENVIFLNFHLYMKI